MPVTTELRKLFLRGFKWDSEEQGLSLYDVLKAAARAQSKETQSGKILTGTAANGGSFTFTLPAQANGLSPYAVTETLSNLLDVYDAAVAYLISTGIPTPTDAQIFTEMMANLIPIKETFFDPSTTHFGTSQLPIVV